MLKYTYKRVLLTLILGLNALFSSFAYNGTDLLQELVGNSTTVSQTQVRYRWILKSSLQYTLVQQAIDQWYIKNKNLIIKLKYEFTNDSLRSRAQIYAGVRLPIYGDAAVTDETRSEAIKLIRAGYTSIKQPLPTNKEDIQQELIRLLERDRISDQKRINQLLKLLGDDPYAQNYSGKNAQDFDNLLQWELVGIGVSLQKDSENNTIIGHVYDGPAKNAGIQKGDSIIRVDNTMITKKTTLTDVGDLIQWKEWTTVVIALLRDNKVIEYTINRKKITIDPIVIEDIWTHSTLMTISMFQTNTYDSFIKKLPSLQQSKSIVIDLRNNLWWSLEDTRQMLNHFIPKGNTLYSIQTNTDTEKVISQWAKQSLSPSTPIYFLTNNDTASASEIFAGVIHEYYPNSKIIGTTTYGKWTVQTVYETSSQTVKFTTGKRLLGKSNTWIDGIWLQPDVIISDKIDTPQDEVIDYVLKQL